MECVVCWIFVVEIEGKLIFFWVDCFLMECFVFVDNICLVCDFGWVGFLDCDEKLVFFWVFEDVDWGFCCVFNDGRFIWVEGGISWLFFWVKCLCELFKSLCSFLFFFNISNCFWFYDFIVMFLFFFSLLCFRFNWWFLKEFCFDKLF